MGSTCAGGTPQQQIEAIKKKVQLFDQFSPLIQGKSKTISDMGKPNASAMSDVVNSLDTKTNDLSNKTSNLTPETDPKLLKEIGK